MSSKNQDNNSHESKRPGFFRLLFTICWIAAGIALIVLAVFWFHPLRNAAITLWRDLTPGPKVFRQKISEDLMLAQNLVRQKIQATDPSEQSQTAIKTMPPTTKKTVTSEPAFVPPEKQKPEMETGSQRPLQPQAEIETAVPAEVRTMPSQPSPAVPHEKREALQMTEPGEPPPPQTEDEAPIPIEEKAISSLPNFPPPEKRELTEGNVLKEPIQQQTEIETPPPVGKKSAPSLPGPRSSESAEMSEETAPRQAEVQPPRSEMEDFAENSEKKSIHREKWLLSQDPASYTIQLMGVRTEALLYDFVKENQLLEKNEIAFYQTTFKNEPWFQLLYGVYATKKEALSAAEDLPANIRKSSPWVRRLSGVQKAIRRKAAQ